jgi:hypothetical protein
MTAPSLGARGAHAVNENPTAARNQSASAAHAADVHLIKNTSRYNTNKDYKNHQSYS